MPPALEEQPHRVSGATEPVSVQLARRDLISSFRGTSELNCLPSAEAMPLHSSELKAGGPLPQHKTALAMFVFTLRNVREFPKPPTCHVVPALLHSYLIL